MIKNKTCTKCKSVLQENDENFYLKNKNKPEMGYCSSCKNCMRKESLKHRNENKDEYIKYSRNYDSSHKEKRKEINKKYRKNNSDKKREYQQKWFSENKNKLSKYLENRKNKKHEITDEEWEFCKKYFNFTCAYCGLPLDKHTKLYGGKPIKTDFHKDHFDDNGSNTLDNCVPACHSCNSKKWKFLFEEWYTTENPIYSSKRLKRILDWINIDCRI